MDIDDKECFRAVTSAYYHGAFGALLVYGKEVKAQIWDTACEGGLLNCGMRVDKRRSGLPEPDKDDGGMKELVGTFLRPSLFSLSGCIYTQAAGNCTILNSGEEGRSWILE